MLRKKNPPKTPINSPAWDLSRGPIESIGARGWDGRPERLFFSAVADILASAERHVPTRDLRLGPACVQPHHDSRADAGCARGRRTPTGPRHLTDQAGRRSGVATKPFSGAGEVVLKQQSAPIAPIKQRGSIMWNIVSALIYYFIIEPRWKLTSSDVASIRGAGPVG